jgi:ADP-ribose pyrophosphatase YjhB (NUDIX family)
MGYVGWIRGYVGHRKIFLAFASIVLRDDANRILLQRRTDFNVWGLPGGSLERGEGLRACARRELREETGLSAGELSLVGIYTDPRLDVTYPNGDQVQQFTVCFSGRANGGSMQVDGTENSEQRYFSPGELPYEQIPVHYQAMLRDALHAGPPAFSPPYRAARTHPQLESVRPWIEKNLYIAVGACAVVREKDGGILACRGADQPYWTFPWDFMRLGENAAWTARRAVQRISGYSINPKRLLGVYSSIEAWSTPSGANVQPLLAVFDCPILEDRPPQKHHPELDWIEPGALIAQLFPPVLADLHRSVMQPGDSQSFIAA